VPRHPDARRSRSNRKSGVGKLILL
jgi:hypothetical protein